MLSGVRFVPKEKRSAPAPTTNPNPAPVSKSKTVPSLSNPSSRSNTLSDHADPFKISRSGVDFSDSPDEAEDDEFTFSTKEDTYVSYRDKRSYSEYSKSEQPSKNTAGRDADNDSGSFGGGGGGGGDAGGHANFQAAQNLRARLKSTAKSTSQDPRSRGSEDGEAECTVTRVKKMNALLSKADTTDIASMVALEKLGGREVEAAYQAALWKQANRPNGTQVAVAAVGRSGGDEDDMGDYEHDDDNDSHDGEGEGEGEGGGKSTMGKKNKSRKVDEKALLQAHAQHLMADKKRLDKSKDNCVWCKLASAGRPQGSGSSSYGSGGSTDVDTVVSVGEWCAVRLKPLAMRMTDNHCEIFPLSHVASTMTCDDPVVKEIERYKKCLERMFERDGYCVLFMEAAVGLRKHPHMRIDVIPVKSEELTDVILNFKEAMLSSDEEWSTHRKIINLTQKKPLHAMNIPAHFPYVSVEWSPEVNVPGSGPLVGYAHIVEDEEKLSGGVGSGEEFCLEVLSSALDSDPPFQIRRRSKVIESRDQAKQKVTAFKTLFETFDWTQYI